MDYKNYNPRAAALAQARTLLTDAVKAAVADGTLPEAALPDFIVEIPADVKNGDIASNVAMAGARAFHKAPRQIAEAITAKLQLDGSLFDRFEVAGPGFINLFLGQDWFTSVVRAAVANPEYGRTDAGAGKKYNVEFVSANPTGPMHMGNARGGALGDGLAACLDWAGYDVTREFYINDAGNQIEKFGKSLAIRYLQLYKGEDACPLPEECYQGADIIARAKEFAEVHGDAYVNKDFDELKKAIVADALPKNIAGLQRDLGKYGIRYDVWFHESDLRQRPAQSGPWWTSCWRPARATRPRTARSCTAAPSTPPSTASSTSARPTTAARRRPRTRCSSAPTASRPILPPTLPTTTTSWPCAALTRPSTSGAPTTTATCARMKARWTLSAGRQPSGHRADADGQPHARRQARRA